MVFTPVVCADVVRSGIWEIMLKIKEELQVRARKTIDSLPIVTDTENYYIGIS